jgi:hypothetical protein
MSGGTPSQCLLTLQWCALWTEERGEAGRQGASELYLYRGHVMYALGPHLHPCLPHGQAEPCAGQVWLPPGSLRCTRLSHSETVGDTAWAGPDQSHPPPTHAAPVCLGARGLGPPDPRWHETCGETGQGARVGLRASRLLSCRGVYEVSQPERRPHGSTAPRKKGARRCH